MGYTGGTRGEIEHFQLHTTFYHNFTLFYTLFFHCVGFSNEQYAVGGVFFSSGGSWFELIFVGRQMLELKMKVLPYIYDSSCF